MAKETFKARLERLFREYGRVAIVTYLGIWIAVLIGFGVAISAGVPVEGAAGKGTVLLGAWASAKVTQPLRIGATIMLTPLVARLWNRLRSVRPTMTALSDSSESNVDASVGSGHAVPAIRERSSPS